MVDTTQKDLAPSPDLGDIISHFFTEKPVVPASFHTWIAFFRSTAFFIVIDILGYFTNAYGSGQPINMLTSLAVLGPQVLYIGVRTFQKVVGGVNSPMKPLLSVAADMGVQNVTTLITRTGQKPMDVSGLPDIPPDDQGGMSSRRF